jgi:hypothetical protein
MQSDNAATTAKKARGTTERVFTLESANRSLILVRRIVGDVVTHYTQLMALRARREELAADDADEHLPRLRRRIEQQIETLNRLQEELAEIGCSLKDWALGLIDFPSMHQGRKVWLCWRLGEATVGHWHEWDSGYTGRQPVGPDFG